MTSFISNFKKYLLKLKPLFLALLVIYSIECTIFFNLENHDLFKRIYKENLLNLTFLKDDDYTKYIITYKNYAFFESNPNLLIVGDSSALNGAKPLTMEKFLPEKKIINAACCAISNFDGYLAIASHFFKNNKSIEYLILYITPGGLPAAVQKKFGNEFGKELMSTFAQPWHFLYQLPSIYFRKETLETVYGSMSAKDEYGNYKPLNYALREATSNSDENYIKFITESKGWVPHGKDNKKDTDMLRGQCGPNIADTLHDKNGQPVLIKTLEKFQKLAQKNHARLIIVFNPVVCTYSSQVDEVISELDKLQRKYPDILIPFGLIHTFDEKYFANQNNLNPEGAEEFSTELAKKLAEMKI